MSKKLLILDIDQTLINTERFPTDYLSEGSYDFKFKSSDEDYEYFVIKRPYLNEFLDWSFDNFKVAIWTAAGDKYATHILANIGIDPRTLEFFHTQEHCTLKMDYESGSAYGLKNLSKIRKKYDLDNVLIVDDIHLTAANNYGNLVHIKPFITDKKDTELLKLKLYLEKIKDAKNFRSIEKRGWDNS